MRLIITGKTLSGKTTAIHRLLATALRRPWRSVTVCDGKGHLNVWAGVPGVTYLGPTDLRTWADRLEPLAEGVPIRYAALLQRGLYEAAPEDPRDLILIDEVQKGTRAKKGVGKRIKDALSLMAEQSAALGDVLILSSQRAVNAIPPDVRANANAELTMLGRGYFFYKTDGAATVSGRVQFIEPAQALAMLDEAPDGEGQPLIPTRIPDILGRIVVEPTRAQTTLYLGAPGSGKTYALQQHRHGATRRHIYVDLSLAQRAALVKLIETAGAVVPIRANMSELTQIASLAVQAEPTLLLFDNIHVATSKTLTCIKQIMTAAGAVAMAANTPESAPARRRVERFYARSEIKEIKPIDKAQAKALLWATLDRAQVKWPRSVEAKVLQEANGNPGTVVKLARRIRKGDQRELRQIHTPVKKVNIGWLVLLIIIAVALVSRRVVDSYLALGILTAVAIGLRPMMYRLMRDV